VRSRAFFSLVAVLALAATACGGDSGGGGGPPTGSTTAVTQAQADEAMGGLCDIATGGLVEMADVHEAFHGRAHETLHAVAAQAQEVDPVVAGALLEAKSVVEADLEEERPPPDLPGHATSLLGAFSEALLAIGLVPADCLLPV
jgi:hypothetical protein